MLGFKIPNLCFNINFFGIIGTKTLHDGRMIAVARQPVSLLQPYETATE
jgi:hypothetical protein